MRVLTDWLLTPERAAVHLPTATAVIADLHLGYDEVRRRRGDAVPLAGLDETLTALNSLLCRHEVRRLAIAGDLFEDGRRSEAGRELIAWLVRRKVALAGVVPGNHDRGLREAGGAALLREGLRLGKWHVVHGDEEPLAGRVVQGHVHPCLRWAGGRRAACYLVARDRLILPAFSADAAGVNVLRRGDWDGYRCYAVAGEQVLDLGEVRRLADVLRRES